MVIAAHGVYPLMTAFGRSLPSSHGKDYRELDLLYMLVQASHQPPGSTKLAMQLPQHASTLCWLRNCGSGCTSWDHPQSARDCTNMRHVQWEVGTRPQLGRASLRGEAWDCPAHPAHGHTAHQPGHTASTLARSASCTMRGTLA